MADASGATEAPWSIVQYTLGDDPAPVLGIGIGSSVRRPPVGFPSTALALFDAWSMFEPALRSLDPDVLEPVPAARLAPPITYPRKVICAGANFHSHIAEMHAPVPKEGAAPFFFLKPPTTTVIGPGDATPMPSGEDPRLDWEAELAIVIGRAGKHLDPASAREHVAGFTIADDVSARGRFAREGSGPPFDWDWMGQKDQDGSCPLGPGIVPTWLVPEIDRAPLRLAVNGETMQDSTLDDLIVGIDGLVAAASALVTLEPGDVILAGTPAGVGLPRNRFLAVGDRVSISIGGLGRLEHAVGPALEGPRRS